MSTGWRALVPLAAVTTLLIPAAAATQDSGSGVAATRPPAAFYGQVEPVAFTLTINMAVVRADTMDEAPSRPATVSVRDADGKTVELPATVKTHGRWRLTHCEFPPLSINFGDTPTDGTPFAGVGKTRMTSVCHNSGEYEQYVLQELHLYRMYHRLTPFSQATRAVQVTWVDSASRKRVATRYGFLIEDRDSLASRLNSVVMKAEGAIASDLEPGPAAVMGVFEYMIGNTDFYLPALHNVLLLATANGGIVPVAYDFDYSGAINTPYAVPNEVLKISSVRDRLFRGPCASDEAFLAAFRLFRERRAELDKLYDDAAGKKLRWNLVRDMQRYFDDFYRVIDDTSVARVDIISKCVK